MRKCGFVQVLYEHLVNVLSGDGGKCSNWKEEIGKVFETAGLSTEENPI
jgi:hypothetical protein